MKLTKILLSVATILICILPSYAFSFDLEKFREVEGYTVIDVTNAVGNFEGADYDKLIELDNGMIFRFSEYSYSYSYRPTVVIFARYYSLEDLKKYVPKATSGLTSYKLLIDNDFYDANRMK